MTRTLAHHIGWVLACSLLASQATAVAPYTATDREERQEPWLQALRAEFDPDLVLTTANEFATNGHLVEMAAELEAQKRELSGTDVDFEDLDDQLLASVNRLVTLLDSDNSCSSENPPTGCTTNIVIVWRTIFLAAYVLAKHDDLSWSQSTKDAAQALFRSHDLSYKGLSGLGNTSIPVIGTRLLGGLALDDAGLRIRGETEFVHAFDEDIRRGIPEPMSPHYAGPTLSELALLIDGLGPECSAPCAAPDLNGVRQKAQDFMSLMLTVIGHHYLPGGGVGSPQDRKGGGALTDKDPTRSDHLIQTLNTLVYDPSLDGTEVTFIHRLAGVAYNPEEIVRSIFLDKGDGYTFWRRDRKAHLTGNGGDTPGIKAYALGIDGAYWDYFEDEFVEDRMPVNPVQVFMLPDGNGAAGIRYGTGGGNQISSGTYLRDPDGSTQASTADLGFAILHHRQPKNGPLGGDDFTDPLDDDPLWMHERLTPHRRMMLGGTTITLFDTSEVPAGGETALWDFTQAHLPDFSGESASEAIQDTCNGWRVFGVKDKWWLGFHPLGSIDEETSMDGPHDPDQVASNGDEQGGDWTYLELSTTSSITGDVTVLEAGSAYDVPGTYATLALAKAAFCDDLDDRDVTFDASGGWASVEAIEPGTGLPVTMKLTHDPETRTLEYATGGPVVQADEDFLDHGLLHSVWVGDPDSAVSFDDATFELSIERSGYDDLVLYYGPDGGVATTTPPTAPGVMEVRWQNTNWTQTHIRWNDMPWDDESIDSFQVWRGEPGTGTLLDDDVPGTSKTYTDAHDDSELTRCALQIQQNPVEELLYTVRARDEDGNLSPNHARLLAPEDAKLPSTVSDLSAEEGGDAEIDLDWSAATDECNVYAYRILRDDGASGPLEAVATVVGAANTSWTDTCRDPSLTYTYEVQAVDTAPNWGPGVQITGTAGDATLPEPEIYTASSTSQSVTLIWYSVGNPCVLRYEVERDDGQSQTILPTGYIWYQDEPPVGTYTYRVRMVSTWGEPGPWNDPVGPFVIQ